MRDRGSIKIGITMGDPGGVGPEISAKCIGGWRDKAAPILIGDGMSFSAACRGKLSFPRGFELIDLKNVSRASYRPGRICAEYGKASVEYLDKAMEMLASGEIDCLVTCPISKEAINLGGYHYSGHTEYLAERSACPDVVMMLVNDVFRFSLVTRHVPLADVSRCLTKKKIAHTLKVTRGALTDLFGISDPSLVVLGMNPHGSDNGLIGNEENSVIKPAVRACRLSGVTGPLGADVAVSAAAKGSYDGVVAMYHDQALIPLKLTGDSNGVNMTLGLPFVRTSPLHGTAFDIAGKGKADPSSLRAAVKLALKCARNQKKV